MPTEVTTSQQYIFLAMAIGFTIHQNGFLPV